MLQSKVVTCLVHVHSVGCTAEMHQISQQEDGMLIVVSKGLSHYSHACLLDA